MKKQVTEYYRKYYNYCKCLLHTGFESLLGVVDTTCKDSFDLFYGLYRYDYYMMLISAQYQH